MEWLRQDYLDYMAGRSVPRPMLVELFGPLVSLPEQWREQGASESEIDMTAFGFDFVRRHRIGVAGGFFPQRTPETVEEDDEYLIERDGMGRLVKLPKGKATIALPLEYPVTDENDWLELKPYYAYDPARFTPGWKEAALRARENGALVVAHIPGGYDEVRQLMGDEEACISFLTQPELIRDMLATFSALNERILREIARGAGAELFQLDSDGNITPVLDALMRGGINSVLPNEPAAGMDIVALRERYGDSLRLVGGIDKFAVRHSKEAIDRELAYKLQGRMREGGVLFGLDHRIPDGTPLENYRYYVSEAARMLGLSPDRERGWARMAF